MLYILMVLAFSTMPDIQKAYPYAKFPQVKCLYMTLHTHMVISILWRLQPDSGYHVDAIA